MGKSSKKKITDFFKKTAKSKKASPKKQPSKKKSSPKRSPKKESKKPSPKKSSPKRAAQKKKTPIKNPRKRKKSGPDTAAPPNKKRCIRSKKGPDEQGRVHGKSFNKYGGKVIYFNPDMISDASDSSDDEVASSMYEKVGSRGKAYKQKEKKPSAVKKILSKRTKGKKDEYLVKWKDGSDDTWEPLSKVKHLDEFVTYSAAVEKWQGKWEARTDRFLCKLTKKKSYKKPSGAYDKYKFCMRMKKSIIAINNRLKRQGFTYEQNGPPKPKQRKEKKKEPEREILGESKKREGSNFTEVDNLFTSKKVKYSDKAKKMLKELKVSTKPQQAPSWSTSMMNKLKKAIKDNQIILIVGATGSGKSTLLNSVGTIFEPPVWDKNKAVISSFPDFESALECLSSIGFNTIPSWLKPYHVLSQGEAYRALLAQTIHQCSKNGEPICLDDFTSNLDRVSARACSGSLQKCIRRAKSGSHLAEGKYILATSNYDIIPWLQPDVVVEITKGKLKFHENPNENYLFDVKAHVDMNKIPRKKSDWPELVLPSPDFGDLETEGEQMNCLGNANYQLVTKVTPDELTLQAECVFDHPFTGEIRFNIPAFPHEQIKKQKFHVGFISGPSGTGKTSTAYKYFSQPTVQQWAVNKPVIGYFSSAKSAKEIFGALDIDLSNASKAFDQLGSGTQELVNIAIGLDKSQNKTIVFDEFTSCQDRVAARALAKNISDFARQTDRSVVLVACHEDLLDSSGLSPDWWFSTKTTKFTRFQIPSSFRKASFPDFNTKVVFTLPKIKLNITGVNKKGWVHFQEHHYKDKKIRNDATCYMAWAEFENLDIPSDLVGWCCFRVGQKKTPDFPNTPLKEHRTVVFPDYQGLGFASRICDACCEIGARDRSLMTSKTAHKRYGAYRDKSPLWTATKSNHDLQKKAPDTMFPFLSLEEKKKKPVWVAFMKNWKPKMYYDHIYNWSKTSAKTKSYFKKRVTFIERR